jgi:hypothetical protein
MFSSEIRDPCRAAITVSAGALDDVVHGGMASTRPQQGRALRAAAHRDAANDESERDETMLKVEAAWSGAPERNTRRCPASAIRCYPLVE